MSSHRARHTAVRLGLFGVPGLADNRHCAAGLAVVPIERAALSSDKHPMLVHRAARVARTDARKG